MAFDNLTPAETARIAFADEMRRGLHLAVGGDPTAEQFNSATAAIAAAFDGLADAPRRSKAVHRFTEQGELAVPADGEEFDNSLDRPVSGLGNPWSVPLRVFRDGDNAVTTVFLDDGYEGAPGRAHGGLVSAIYDDLFGFLTVLHRGMAFTASLSINYRAATPVRHPATFTAWIEQVDGRKIHMAGECHVDGELVTEATALFIDASEFFAEQVAQQSDTADQGATPS